MATISICLIAVNAGRVRVRRSSAPLLGCWLGLRDATESDSILDVVNCWLLREALLATTFGSLVAVQSAKWLFPTFAAGVTLVSSCAVISRSPALGQKRREGEREMDG